MIRRLVAIIPLLLIVLALEFFVYGALEPVFEQNEWTKWVYILFQVGAYASIIYSVFTYKSVLTAGVNNPLTNVIMGSTLAFLLPKLLFSLAIFAEGMIQFLWYLWLNIKNLWAEMGEIVFPERLPLFAQIMVVVALLLFVLLLYGVIFGKYRYRVNEITIISKDVPSSFDGYKIVQISDVHSGTFDSVAKVQKGIDLVNQQEPDLVLFTGDMVNNLATEIEPFISAFSSIKSKDGKFSVLGNHDYGDYVRWKSNADKSANLAQLITYQNQMGFKMLKNIRERIEKNGSFINLLGVENWGKPPFPQHGDLEKASQGINSNEFTILMSHDPSHWDYEVKQHPKNINLTLSGHTHGMQLGIDWLGIKWSPVKYRYRKWAGLYTEDNKHLYVNRGFGFLGWPGRLGIWPEITVINLGRS